jgi:nitroreductase
MFDDAGFVEHDGTETGRESSRVEFVAQHSYLFADLLGLPAGMEVAAIMAIGYPAEDKPPHPSTSLAYDKVHRETYGTPWQGKP